MVPAECFREAEIVYAARCSCAKGLEACCPRFAKWMRVAVTGIVLRRKRRSLFKPDCERRRLVRVRSSLNESILRSLFKPSSRVFLSFDCCIVISVSVLRTVPGYYGDEVRGAFLELSQRIVKGS